INRDLLARQIRLLGLRAEAVENGKAALELWRSGGFSMVITDCHMPEMDGYELARKIRTIESEESIPRTTIIAWTANALAEETEHCLQAGMDDILVKPAGMTELKDKLSKWTKRRNFVDLEMLSTIVKDEAAQIQLLNDFLKHILTDLGKLPGMFESGDLAGMKNTAHRMKGSSRMVGARLLAEACEAVEKAAGAGDAEKALASKAGLERAVCDFESFLSGKKQ
ncbi:MAG TPA: response regulator, partial [Burkholderiales bacterium]|nr:response regulator [Burkholderiales bacterium]